MALTQVKTLGIADDAVTGAKIADDTVAEANMANDAISLTELKAGTDGQIISWDANGNPVAVGPGNSGQVLTSNGSGAAPTFQAASGAALSGSTNNTICTVTGANAIQGETNLTFDGNDLVQTIDAGGEGIKISAAGNHYPVFTFDADRSSANNNCGQLEFKWDGTSVARIAGVTGADTTNKDDGHIVFATAPSGTLAERARIASNGAFLVGTSVDNGFDFKVSDGGGYEFAITCNDNSRNNIINYDRANSAYVDARQTQKELHLWTGTSPAERLKIDAAGDVTVSTGNVIIGTSGKGISFAATGDGNGSDTSELFDDYEEGTWTPTLPNSGSASLQELGYARYTKTGRIVTWEVRLRFQASNSNYAIPDNSDTFQIGGLPYDPDGYGGGVVTYGDGSDLSGSNSLSVLVWSGNPRIYFHLLTTDTTAPTNSWARAKWSNKYVIFSGWYTT